MNNTILVADEVWLATALLHRHYPESSDFSVKEIVEQARKEKMTGTSIVRPGVQVHAYLHCVANKPPNPGRYRMLVETSKGRRRLFRPGDPFHPARSSGKELPDKDGIPPEYAQLIEWYRNVYINDGGPGVTDPILSLQGLGKDIWKGEDADTYVNRVREGWL